MNNNTLKSVVNKARQRRYIKRGLALLCVFVLLFTMNTLKRNANTLERVPMCGYAEEHVHMPECYDGDALVCGRAEHIHTDACYQEVPGDGDEMNVQLADTPVEDLDSENLDGLLSLSEDDFALVTDDVAPAQPVSNATEAQPKAFILGEGTMVSRIIDAVGLDVSLAAIINVAVVDDATMQADAVGIEKDGDDYRIFATRDFDRAQLALVVEGDILLVDLLDGVAVREKSDAPAEIAEETAPAAPVAEEIMPVIEDSPVEDSPAGEVIEERIDLPEPAQEAQGATPAAEADETGEITLTEDAQPVEGEIIETGEEPAEDEAAETEEEPAEDEAVETEEEPAEDEAVETGEQSADEEAAQTEGEPAEDEAAEAEEEPAEDEVTETGEQPAEDEVTETGEQPAEDEVNETGEEPAEDEAAETEEEPAEDEVNETGEEPAEDEAAETEEESAEDEVTETGEQPAEDEASETEEQPVEGEVSETEEQTAEEDTPETEEQPIEEEATETGEQPVEDEAFGTEEQSDEAEASTEEVADEGQAIYTATVDLAEVTDYPLSLNALLAGFAPENEAQAEETPEPAGEDVTEAKPNEAPTGASALSIEYDHDLLDIEAAGDDYLITPVASFESTAIVVDNGSRCELTLVNCTLPEAEGAVEAESEARVGYPARNFEGHTRYVKVVVAAPEGAFPEGTTMAVADVEDEKTLTDIEDTVSEEFVEVKRVHAVDITFRDAEGNEIEPLMPISVVMTVDEIGQRQEAVVVHVDDAGAAEVVDSQSEAPAGETEVKVEMPATEVPEAAQPEDSEAASVGFDADSFSVYAVVITETIDTKYIDAEGATWNISVGYGPEAGIPAGATLAVQEVEGDYLEQTTELLRGKETITLARFFDITILDAEGNAVQPAQPVEVKATLAEQSEDAVKAVHFAEDGPEIIEASQEEDAVSFDAASFSVYGIVYTVDFHYTVNGRIFGYGIPGGDCASLRALLPALNVASDDPETEADELEAFMAGIADVKFTDSELVRVCPVTAETTVGALRAELGLESQYSAALTEADRAEIDARVLTAPDWALFSLLPFTSDEALTVTMENGDSFIIVVTDAQIATRVLAADGQAYKITLTFGPEAEIPLDAELVAREIFSNDPNYIGYVVSAATRLSEEGLNNVSDYRFFDIEIRKDGEKIEPAAPVQVNITYEDAVELPEGAELSVVHFADEGIEVIRDIALNEDNTSLSYEQASFSVSGTIVTGNPASTTNESDVMSGRYMLIAVVDGERYIILNDGTLKKAESFTDTTVKVDFPMAWMYMNGDHLVHRADAVDYNNDKLASAFYWRYLDANKANALSEDTRDNTLLKKNDDGFDVVQTNGRLIYPWTTIKYDPVEHTISNDTENGPTYYIGVATTNGELHVTGLNDREHAAEIYMAEITANTSDGKMQVGAKYNTVNHIDIEVEGYANVTVPLRNGVYYYKDGETVKSFEVTAQNPVGVKYEGTVPVTRDDIKTARVVAYVKDGNVDKVQPDLFYIAGYSANDATDLSTNQVRIEGVYKVADLSHVALTPEQLNSLTDEQRNNLKRNGDGTYDLDILTQGFEDGNGNPLIRSLRLANKVYYSVSTEKLVSFDMMYEGKQLYASYNDAFNQSNNKLKAQAMITLSASFDFWDTRNECPPIYWTPTNRVGEDKVEYDLWKLGDIIISVPGRNEMGIGMDFELGDKNQGQTGTLSAQITKYIVDRAGNRIHPNAPTENTFHVYWNQSIGDSQNVQGKNVGAYQNWEFIPNRYENIHDKRMTVGTEGTGTIYDYDVKPGMLYIEEDHSEDRLARQIVDQNGKTWKYVETRLETEYVWRDDGCYGMYHVSKNYTTEDAHYNSNPEVLGNYYDVNGIGAFNGFVEYFVYNVYEPDVDIDVRKVWKNKKDAPIDAPAGASVTITLGRYKLVPTADYVDGTLTITQNVDGGETNTPFQASYRLLKDGKLVKVGRYEGGNGGTTTITGIPAGEYTLDVKATAPGYTVTNVINPNTVTISSENPNANVTVGSTLQSQTDNKKKITVTCGNKNGATFYDLETYLTEGMKFKLILDRRGPAHDSGLNLQINGTPTPYDWKKDPDIPAGEYTEDQINEFNSQETRVKQEFTYTVGNSDMTLTIYHAWGKYDVKFTLQPIYGAGDTEESTGIGTVVEDSTQGGTPSGSGEDGDAPSSNMTGLAYQVDDSYSEEITLKDGVWAATLHNLPSMNEYGPYLYYIVKETCTPENIVTNAVIWDDGEGHRLTSSGETVLGVTNYVQGDKPSIHIRKVDKDGHPLANAWFGLYDGNGTDRVVADIKSGSDGICTFKNLVDGDYKLAEATPPTGYKSLPGMIPFTVSDGKIVFNMENLPAGIKDLVDFDRETYTLTVENEPDVESNQIKVLKRWQDVKGDEMDPSETSVKVRLRRHKITEKIKHLKVFVEIPLKYKNNGRDDIIKVQEADIAGDTVSIKWNDNGQFDWIPQRLSWYSNEDVVQVVDTTDRTDDNRDNACFELRKLSSAAQNNIEVRFRYMLERMPSNDAINASWFWDNMNNTTISITQSEQAIQNPTESSDDASFYDERTLNADNAWSFTWKIEGKTDSQGTNTFAAKNDQGISYKYYIEEIDMPSGYDVSYSENNGKGIQQGLITVYNRRNTADVRIVKVDKGDEATKLAGAEFTIRRLNPNKKGLASDEGFEPSNKTTPASGEISFDKLPLGTYEIKETHLPDGYIQVGDGAFYIRITTNGVERIMKDTNLTPNEWQTVPSDDFVTMADSTAIVRNTPGVSLPATGGSGTTLYYVLGTLLTLAAVALMIAKRRGRA